MTLDSPSFKPNDFIPRKFTCQGPNINPCLVVRGIPSEAKSLALIVNDIDAPSGDWVHWLVYDIPVLSKIDENSIPGTEGMNSFSRTKYSGPCPPHGIHRYYFHIYALDAQLGLPQGIDKKTLEQAMSGHILVDAEMAGLYKKS